MAFRLVGLPQRLGLGALGGSLSVVPHLQSICLDLAQQSDQFLLGRLRLLLGLRKIGIGLPLGCSIELGLAPGFLFGSPLLCRRRFGRATLRQKAFDPRSSCPAARQSEAGAAWRRRRC